MKTYTSFFNTKESYETFNLAWKDRSRLKQLSSTDMVLRSILLDTDIFKSFTPITRPKKLQNGMTPFMNLKFALSSYNFDKSWIMTLIPSLKESEYLKEHLLKIRDDLKNKSGV